MPPSFLAAPPIEIIFFSRKRRKMALVFTKNQVSALISKSPGGRALNRGDGSFVFLVSSDMRVLVWKKSKDVAMISSSSMSFSVIFSFRFFLSAYLSPCIKTPPYSQWEFLFFGWEFRNDGIFQLNQPDVHALTVFPVKPVLSLTAPYPQHPSLCPFSSIFCYYCCCHFLITRSMLLSICFLFFSLLFLSSFNLQDLVIDQRYDFIEPIKSSSLCLYCMLLYRVVLWLVSNRW